MPFTLRHRHKRLLKRVHKETSADHLIIDNLAIHKAAAVRRRLAAQTRSHLGYGPLQTLFHVVSTSWEPPMNGGAPSIIDVLQWLGESESP